MAQKEADFILSDLDAGEVSLVPKAANKRKFLLMKMEDPSMDEEMATQFDEEIMKAELSEALATPLEDEDAIMKELLEKGTLSSQALQAVRGMVRLSRGLEGELPGNFMDMLRGMMGATPQAAAAGKQAGKAPGRDKALDRYTKTKSTKEDEEMAEEVTKEEVVTEEDPKAAATPTDSPVQEPVSKASDKKKAADDDDDEEDDKKKKLPAFLKKKKDKTEKAADDGDLDLDALPEAVRARVQNIFKSQNDLEQRNAEIKKEQEETLTELRKERDDRATEQAIQKAAVDYPNLPVKSEDLGPIVKLAKAHFSDSQVETFTRILKAADDAIAKSNAFEVAKSETYELTTGSEDSALGQLRTIAKGYVEKSEDGITEAAAFAKAADQNPGLYDQYLQEQRG